MAVSEPGLKVVGVLRPAVTQIDVGMVGGFFDEVVVQQWPVGRQKEDVQRDDYGQQKRGRCRVAFVPVTLGGLPFSR
jgi:hypothetical protein